MESIEREIELRDYLRILVKRRWIIVMIFMIVVSVVSVKTFTAIPVYESVARILIEKENPQPVAVREASWMPDPSLSYYQTQYKIITSKAIAAEVIRRLNLENSTEFFSPPRDDIMTKIKSWFRGILQFWQDQIKALLRGAGSGEERKPVKSRISIPSSNFGTLGLTDMDAKKEVDPGLIAEVRGRIKVAPVEASRLADVSVTARDPVIAAKIANEVVRAYIDMTLETRLEAARDAVRWLNERIAEERKKVEDAEKALLDYKQKHGIITDFSSDAEKINAQKLATLNSQLLSVEAERVGAETSYKQALALEKDIQMLDAIPDILTNGLIQEIKRMEMGLYNRMSELSKKYGYGSNHPQMVAIQAELDELNTRKIKEARHVVDSLRNAYKLALAKEQSIRQSLESQKREMLDLNEKAVQYGVLRRQVDSSKHMYDLLIQRFKETSLTEEMRTGNIQIIDKAEVGSTTGPDKKRKIFTAIVGGLILGIAAAFLLEFIDNTIKLPDEIKNYLKIPYLGPIPLFELDKGSESEQRELIAVHSPKSTATESFRGIRTAILFSSADTAPQVILITSSGPSEGKTLCAVNLAVTMAQAGSSVVVIDCDMRRPRIHKVFETDREEGVSSILVGTTELDDTILKTNVPNLDIIPCGPIPPNPSEILGSKKMASFIDSLREKYKCIIIDSPPASVVTDSIVLSKITDGVILVVRSGDTPRRVVLNTVAQLQSVNAHIFGCILNGIKTGRDSYYYSYYYYYYYSDEGERKEKRKRHTKEKVAA